MVVNLRKLRPVNVGSAVVCLYLWCSKWLDVGLVYLHLSPCLNRHQLQIFDLYIYTSDDPLSFLSCRTCHSSRARLPSCPSLTTSTGLLQPHHIFHPSPFHLQSRNFHLSLSLLFLYPTPFLIFNSLFLYEIANLLTLTAKDVNTGVCTSDVETAFQVYYVAAY